MKKNKIIYVGALTVIVIVAIAIWHQQTSQNNRGGFTIGVAVAETGDAAEWGQGEYQVTKMLVDDFNAQGGLNGQPINLNVEDTKTTGDGTVNAIIKLINIDHVPVILGPTWMDSYQGANPIAEQAKVVMLTPSAAMEVVQSKQVFTYLFSTFWPELPEIQRMTGYMVTHSMQKLAIINDRDPYDSTFSGKLADDAQAKGMTLVDREQIPVDQNDLRTEILKIKQFHPDAVFVEINNVGNLGSFMKQVKQLGLVATVFTTADAQNQDSVSKFGSYMEGMTYPFPATPSSTAYTSFVKEFQKKYGVLPSSPSAITTYNAVQALLEVLKNGARTGTEIRDALRTMHASGLGTSDISFNDFGAVNTADFDMKMIHNSQFVTIPNQ